MRTLDLWLISAQTRMIKAKESAREFFTSERGIAPIVATVLILLITVLLVTFVWDELKEWVDGLTDKIFSTDFNSDGLDGPT